MLNKEVADNTFDLLIAAGLNETLSKFAAAQSAHETSGFNSAILKSNNNLFGMKYAGQILAAGEKNGYANYNNHNDSVKDFVKWYTKHRNAIFSLPLIIYTLKDYVNFLKRNNYFEADENDYYNGCNYFYNLMFNE